MHVLVQEGDIAIPRLVQSGKLFRGRHGRTDGIACGGRQNGRLLQLARHVVLHIRFLKLFGAGQGGGVGRALQVGPHQHHPAGVDGKAEHAQDGHQQNRKQRHDGAAALRSDGLKVHGAKHLLLKNWLQQRTPS